MKRALRRVAIAALFCAGAVVATVVACTPSDYTTSQSSIIDGGVVDDSRTANFAGDTGGEPGGDTGMDTPPGDDGGMDGGTTGDGGGTTGDGGGTTGDGGGTTGDGGGTTGDGGGDGGNGGSGSQNPTGTPDNNANLESFYQCNVGSPAGAFPIGLALAALALRRRRRS